MSVLTASYETPLGPVLLSADEQGLSGLWFEGQKYFARTLPPDAEPGDNEHLAAARRWLDEYFAGREPDFAPALSMGGTAFQQSVWDRLLTIPYGTTTTYGAIARDLARARGVEKMSARAVGTAVGHNPVSLIVPCHRVVGAGGRLTGYAGGLDRKSWLLEHECPVSAS